MFYKVVTYLTLLGTSQAFAPVHRFSSRASSGIVSTSARSFGMHPEFFHDLPSQIRPIQDAFTTISLSDALEATADTAGAVVEEAAKTDNGWFGFLTAPIEFLLQAIHAAFVTVGMSADAWGVSIIAMTLIIKLATYPLTKTQLESTNKMQVGFGLLVAPL